MTEQNPENSHGINRQERKNFVNKRVDQVIEWVSGLRQQVQEGQLTWEQHDHLIARATVAPEQYAYRLKKQSLIDTLTQIPNRRWFKFELQREMAEADRSGKSLGLLHIDIDHFKNINDSYGYDIGDKALKMIAYRLQKLTRKEDFLGRLGGEEFTVIIIDPQVDKFLEIADRLRKDVENSPIIDQQAITVSIGGTCYQSGENQGDFMKRAANACHQSKEAGRNQVTIS